MAESRRTSEAKRLRPFMATTASGVSAETSDQDILALVAALNTHRSSADHDDRYYTSTETDSLLSDKADKSLTLTAGNGLTGGGNLSAGRTFNVGQGFGIAVAADEIAVDKTANFDWLGNHTFNTDTYVKSLLPILSDLYDLGTYNKLFRKIWGSELSAIVFSKYEQALLGGWLTISKGEGTFQAAVAAADTTIDLGSNNFVTGDMVVVRGISANNTPQMEYITVGTLVSGTTYNVTRNLDGTGANDWPIGTVYGNWGKAGNGRLELNAYDTPRFSVYSHGDTLAAINEQIRIGDLSGNWGYSSSIYGAAFGEYASGKPNLLIEPGVLRLRNYDQDVIKLTGTTASFENVITLGAAGRIQQGTGTWGSNFTGSALWNESGVMNIGGWNAGVKRWWGGSDGNFYANSGKLKINEDGIISDIGGALGPGGRLIFTNSYSDSGSFDGLVMETYRDLTMAGMRTELRVFDEDYPASVLLQASSAGSQARIFIMAQSSGAYEMINMIAKETSISGALNVTGLITGNLYAPSNVGIGTTTPKANLAIGTDIGTFNGLSIGATANEEIRIGQALTNAIILGWKYNATPVNAYAILETYSGSNPLILQSVGGRVGVGILNPSVQFELSGAVGQKSAGTTWSNPSDKRLKKNIKPFTDGLNVITKIKPVTYELNGLARTPKGLKGISVIAQEIKDVAPYTVDTYRAKLHPNDKEDTELYRFEASALIFALINAVKELSAKVEKLEKGT